MLCLTEVAGQSGRRTKKSVSAPPPVTTEQGEPPIVTPSRMSSIIIGGHQIDPGTKEIWSNETSIVADACTDRLKERPGLGLEIVYGGKMTKVQAIERAKKETDTYVLWFGYRSKLVGLDMIIDYLDYIVLVPQTAGILTEGRVYPSQQKASADPGGILRLPSRRSQRTPNSRLLERGGREIADRIRGVL